MVPAGLPVVVRVKRKRNLEPVDTIVVEADETPAAKRRAHDAALAAELDAVLAGAMAGGAVTKQETDTSRAQGGAGADVSARAGEIAALETAMKSTGYVFVDMTSNAAYNMLYGCQRVGACAVDFAEHKA